MNSPLIRSLLTLQNPFNSTEEIIEWIEGRNHDVRVCVEPAPFSELKGWSFNSVTGNLEHYSGKFFSIVGLDVMTNVGTVSRWTQPVINQPEVGCLGIIAKEFQGVLYFLLQAKIEPGNVNCVQLSPTLQATRSNYTCVHGGRSPAYLDYFKNARPEQILLDQLQSEQGGRFYRKRNRNIIILVTDDLKLGPDFRWLTLGQIKSLIAHDNMVNMDTRTVLSGLRFGNIEATGGVEGLSPLGGEMLVSESLSSGLISTNQALHQLSELKSRYELVVDKIPLNLVGAEWQVTATEIVRVDRRYFRVLGVNVSIANREVATWSQPIVEPMQEGLCVLFVKRIHGVLHFLLQAKVECGNFDVVEFAPTIQCLTGDYKNPTGYVPKFLKEFATGTCVEKVLFDTKQSEEGGRFYHEQNRNVLVLANDAIPDFPPENFMWLTLGQIKEFLRFNNYLNIQVRSLIAALRYV